MKTPYTRSPLARALAGAALAASILGSVEPASAVTCSLPFPSVDAFCVAGSSVAKINHQRFVQLNERAFTLTLSIDWQGGTVGAVAYPIDVNGNHLNNCFNTVADGDNGIDRRQNIPCSRLFGANTPGTVFTTSNYDHAVEIQSTFVIVI